MEVFLSAIGSVFQCNKKCVHVGEVVGGGGARNYLKDRIIILHNDDGSSSHSMNNVHRMDEEWGLLALNDFETIQMKSTRTILFAQDLFAHDLHTILSVFVRRFFSFIMLCEDINVKNELFNINYIQFILKIIIKLLINKYLTTRIECSYR